MPGREILGLDYNARGRDNGVAETYVIPDMEPWHLVKRTKRHNCEQRRLVAW